MAALAANDTESLRRIKNMGESPLSIAISMRLINFAARIIDFNPETLDDIGHNGQTPLHVAIKRNDFEVMSVNQNWSKSKMKEEDSPSLCIMLLFNKDSIVAYIKDNNKKIPLYLAAEKGSIGMVDESQHNLLDLAAMNGNVDAVKYSLNLVEMEDLMNSPDVDGNTALHLAATNYHSDVVTVLSEKTNVKQAYVLQHVYKLHALQQKIHHTTMVGLGHFSTILHSSSGNGAAKSAFNIPGRFKNDEPNAGMAVLISKAAFKAFVISDSIAMTSSITAAVIVFWSSSRRDAESFMDTLPFANWFDLDLTHSNGDSIREWIIRGVTENTMVGHIGLCHR
ncbi:hypothetical protein Gorai_022496, partial [Gossypium raimondii]|nr:hypothetical protein [Gossypium raimondii]